MSVLLADFSRLELLSGEPNSRISKVLQAFAQPKASSGDASKASSTSSRATIVRVGRDSLDAPLYDTESRKSAASAELPTRGPYKCRNFNECGGIGRRDSKTVGFHKSERCCPLAKHDADDSVRNARNPDNRGGMSSAAMHSQRKKSKVGA